MGDLKSNKKNASIIENCNFIFFEKYSMNIGLVDS